MLLINETRQPTSFSFSLQAGYSIYENRDNGHVMSKEEQKEWNVKKDPKLGETDAKLGETEK